MVRLFLVLLLTSGCDQVHHHKHNIRVFLGLSKPTPIPEKIEAVKDFTEEGKKIAEITPQGKFYNLLNGYISAPSPSIKNILIREFQINGKIFKNEDLELISNLVKLAPLIQDGNMDALEIAFHAYANLEGSNQDAVAPIVATGFDYQAKKTLELYLSLKKDQYCSLIGSFGKDFDDEKKIGILESRKANMNEVLADTSIPESLKALIKDCDKTVLLEMTKVNLKKTPIPMPADEVESYVPQVPEAEPTN